MVRPRKHRTIMRQFSFSFAAIAALGFCINTAMAQSNVLIVGDSWAEFLEVELMQEVCTSLTTVVNVGAGGSTAEQWANDPDGFLDGVPNANDVDAIWVSLGGNDFLEASGCVTNAATVAGYVQTVTDHLIVEFPNAQLLLTGYGVPSEAQAEGCDFSQTFAELQRVFEDSSLTSNYNSAKVTIVPVIDLFGGSLDGSFTPSSSEYYGDAIHLNDLGYQVLLQHGPINTFFGGSCTGDGSGNDDGGDDVDEEEEGEEEEEDGEEEEEEEEGGGFFLCF